MTLPARARVAPPRGVPSSATGCPRVDRPRRAGRGRAGRAAPPDWPADARVANEARRLDHRQPWWQGGGGGHPRVGPRTARGVPTGAGGVGDGDAACGTPAVDTGPSAMAACPAAVIVTAERVRWHREERGYIKRQHATKVGGYAGEEGSPFDQNWRADANSGARCNRPPSARAQSVQCRAQRQAFGSRRRRDQSRAWPTPTAAHTGAKWGDDAPSDADFTSGARRRYAFFQRREEWEGLGRQTKAGRKEESWERRGRLVEGKEEQKPLCLDVETWGRATTALSRPPWRSSTGKLGKTSTSDSSETRPSHPSPDSVWPPSSCPPSRRTPTSRVRHAPRAVGG